MAKKKKQLTFEKVLSKLFEYCVQAQKDENIYKPFSWALYKTWTWADSKEEPR